MVEKTQARGKIIQWLILLAVGLMVEGYIGSPLDPLFIGLAAGIYLLFGVALWWSLRYLRAGPSAAVVGVYWPPACETQVCFDRVRVLGCRLFNRMGVTTKPMPLFGALELNWTSLQPFSFFLWPEPLLVLRSTGIIKGKALIREKEFSKHHSPFPKNQVVSVVARLPASLKYGLLDAQHNDCCFVKYYGYKFYKGQPPRRARFFVQGVSSKREREILLECGILTHL